VLIVGTGGLGSPASLYLSGAGVGTIGLVDDDVVEESNLHRQVVHMESRSGMPKVESAKQQIGLFNRFTNIKTHETRFTRENAMDLIRDYDIVLDGSDNAATRYLISDACVIGKKVLVSGSAV
jgi:molybdopterin/thiamine biosynthesis adenylyltransferase